MNAKTHRNILDELDRNGEGISRFGRREFISVFVVFAILAGITGWMVLPPQPVGFYWDDTWYLLMAEWFSGREDHQQLVWSMLHSRQYPPLFPYVLSFTGDILLDQRLPTLVNAVFLSAGASLTMAWLMSERIPVCASALAASLVVFNPVALNLLPFLLSEHLFIFLTCLVLLLCRIKMHSTYQWMMIGTVAGLCVATRTPGWILLLAFSVYFFIERDIRQLLYFLAGLTAGLVAIVYLRAGLPYSPGYPAIYMSKFESTGPAYLVDQAQALGNAWYELWGGVAGALVALAFFLPGLFTRLKECRVDAWYFVFSLGMIMAWPFPEQFTRLLWVLMPSCLVAIYSTINILENDRHRTSLALLLAFFLVVVNLPDGPGRSIQRLLNPPPQELHSLSRMPEWTRLASREQAEMSIRVTRRMLADMHRIKQMVSEDVCVYSDWPSVVSIQTLRTSYSPDWELGESTAGHNFKCPYYYVVPGTWSNTEPGALEKFTGIHREIFRSISPAKAPKYPVIGIFFELQETTG